MEGTYWRIPIKVAIMTCHRVWRIHLPQLDFLSRQTLAFQIRMSNWKRTSMTCTCTRVAKCSSWRLSGTSIMQNNKKLSMKARKDEKRKSCSHSQETWLLKSIIRLRPQASHIAHKGLTSWAWNRREIRYSKRPSGCSSPFTKPRFLVLHLRCFQSKGPWRTPCHNLTTTTLKLRLTNFPPQAWPSEPARSNSVGTLQPSSELARSWRKRLSRKLIYSMKL